MAKIEDIKTGSTVLVMVNGKVSYGRVLDKSITGTVKRVKLLNPVDNTERWYDPSLIAVIDQNYVKDSFGKFNVGDRVQYNNPNYPLHREQGVVTGFNHNVVSVQIDGKDFSITFSPEVLIKLIISDPLTTREKQDLLDIVNSIGR